jgi:hypothetical protein
MRCDISRCPILLTPRKPPIGSALVTRPPCFDVGFVDQPRISTAFGRVALRMTMARVRHCLGRLTPRPHGRAEIFRAPPGQASSGPDLYERNVRHVGPYPGLGLERKHPRKKRSTSSSTTMPPTSIPTSCCGSKNIAVCLPLHSDIRFLAQCHRVRPIRGSMSKQR